MSSGIEFLALVLLGSIPWAVLEYAWRRSRKRKPPVVEPSPPGKPQPSALPPDRRQLLEDWSTQISKEVLARAARGERIAGVAFAAPPAHGRLAWHASLLFLIRVPVAGLAYHAYESEAPRIEKESLLALVREPDNPHDRLAIAVHGPGGKRIGYVPRSQNAVIARLMDAGVPMQAWVMRHEVEREPPLVEIAIALIGSRRAKGVAA